MHVLLNLDYHVPSRSGYAVWFLRMVTSCEIKRRADFFAPFIMVLSVACPTLEHLLLRQGCLYYLSLVPVAGPERPGCCLFLL